MQHRKRLPPIPPPFVSTDTPEQKAREFDKYHEQLEAYAEAEIAADPSHVGRAMRRFFRRKG